jgi:FlaA1/EpsC-like NDP-sugar epimerase
MSLSGLEPGRDVEIVFTGPRSGEKLSEELFAHGEEPRPTQHEKILVAHASDGWRDGILTRHLEELEALVQEGDPAKIRAKLLEIVPGASFEGENGPKG